MRRGSSAKRIEAASAESPFGELTLIDGLPTLIWLSGTDHGGSYFNRTWLEFTGRTLEQERGNGWMEGVHPDDRAVLEVCYAAFVRRTPFEIEFRLRRHDGEYRWMLDHGVPRFADSGEFLGFIGSCLDITDRKLAEERQAVLMSELDHRVRNTLASIRAMLRLSVAGAASKEELAACLEGRIDAYAKAHGLLAAEHLEGAGIGPLISSLVAPYADSAEHRVQLTGPGVVLQPHAALSLTLVVHELATNAARHGALSVADGTLCIDWKVDDGRLKIVWKEENGPPVRQPLRRGFGSCLVESLPQDMGGSARLEFRGPGVRWHADLPVERTLRDADPVSGFDAQRPDGPRPAGFAGLALENLRILIAEDDPLIGQELRAALSAAGASIIGPETSVPAALAAATEQKIDGAVLDVNLRGELVVPLAEFLRQHEIPFVLMTGYSRSSLPPQLQDSTALQKPASAFAIIERLSGLCQVAN